jgi:dehydrogenase/reductase SDR family protein 4
LNNPGLSLDGKVALVTGGRRGIGEACALVFAEAGADVAVCDWVVETGELAAVADKIKKLGRRSLAVKADAKSKPDIDNLVEKVVAELGTIDILVNNAGVGDGGQSTEPADFNLEDARARMAERMALLETSAAVIELDNEAWDKVLENNLKSCLLCSQAAAKVMVKQNRGCIINVASVRAFARGQGAMAAYSISKRGIVMLTEGLAADLAKYGIRVNAIAPGAIETEMMRFAWSDPERTRQLAERTPLIGSLIPPAGCAYTALFLASDLSAYVTGQTIIVDAGLTISQT